MLHLIADAVLTQAVMQRVAAGDDVLLLAGAVWGAYVGHQDNAKLSQLLAQQCHVHVLSDALAANGIGAEQLMPGVRVIDYPAFVDLTVNNPAIHTWG